MMVALSGSVALVVTVDYHKTMAKGGATPHQPRPDPQPHNATHICSNGFYVPKIVQRFAQVKDKEQIIELISSLISG